MGLYASAHPSANILFFYLPFLHAYVRLSVGRSFTLDLSDWLCLSVHVFFFSRFLE